MYLVENRFSIELTFIELIEITLTNDEKVGVRGKNSDFHFSFREQYIHVNRMDQYYIYFVVSQIFEKYLVYDESDNQIIRFFSLSKKMHSFVGERKKKKQIVQSLVCRKWRW